MPPVIDTITRLDTPFQVTATSAGPVVGPGERVTVAVPLMSVVAVWSVSVPNVVLKVTCSLAKGFPSRYTTAVIKEVSVEFAAMVSGDAEIVTAAGTMFTIVELYNPCHVAVTLAVPVPASGLRVTLATPLASVVSEVDERFPRVVANVTGSPITGLPLSRMVTVTVEFMLEPAPILFWDAEISMVPSAMVTSVAAEMPSHMAVIVAVPVIDSGLRMTVASPLLLVVAEVVERLPRFVVNVTSLLLTGIESRVMCAVIVEVMEEAAAIMLGAAETTIVPWTMFTMVEFDRSCQEADTFAVPGVAPGNRVMVAMPLALVVAVVDERPLMFVENVTGVLTWGIPFKRTKAAIVEFIVDPVARVAGDAVTIRLPCAMLTVAELDIPFHVAVMVAVPVVGPAVNVTTA